MPFNSLHLVPRREDDDVVNVTIVSFSVVAGQNTINVLQGDVPEDMSDTWANRYPCKVWLAKFKEVN
jgi:hypothetical protein